MKKQLAVASVVMLLVGTLFTLSAFATDAQMYFSSDRNAQTRVTNVQLGDEVWIVVIDNDQNIDDDLRDKMWVDLKVFDPKTGAYIIWNSYDREGNPGYIGMDGNTTLGDFLEETGADTGVFVSNRAFQIGTRESFKSPEKHTHVVDDDHQDFKWGNYLYAGIGERGWFGPPTAFTFTDGLMPATHTWPVLPSGDTSLATQGDQYLVGRFENMNTLIGLYQDPNDPTDVAVAMMKIIDTPATIEWDTEVFDDPRGAATITVVDHDENVNCNKAEWVPVFIIVNPGSWNPVQAASPTNFCMLLRTGGVVPNQTPTNVRNNPIRWYNIYNSGLGTPFPNNNQPTSVGAYYIQYPVIGNVTTFDTMDPDGFVRVMFYAQETGVSTGIFQLNINDLRRDLGFNMLNVRDVLVAYYLDPNDFDDFALDTAYIEERHHSITSFTDAGRADKDVFWLGRDPVYVQVIDANANVDPCCPEQVVVHICDPHGEDDSEWLILDETSSNSPVFFSFAGARLLPVWDALGVGTHGGFQLQLDNWTIEAFNEDTIFVRYNDVYYMMNETGMGGLGDASTTTAFPPVIDRVRVANDISFDLMTIGDTQVFDGTTVNMFFLDRQGNRVTGYVSGDCLFIQVVDPDQDEDQFRRERIDGHWDGGQNHPFGPLALNAWDCGPVGDDVHWVNHLLGDTPIFNETTAPKVFVLNPRNGHWAAVDLLETGVGTGTFVSVICVELVRPHICEPQLGVRPGDTILAFYQDPSNHSDSAMISIKIGIGGAVTPPADQSTTMFVDADGAEVQSYTDADLVFVKVFDPSQAGATKLDDAVDIGGVKYDLTPFGEAAGTFRTEGLNLGLEAGDTITATYTDPADPMDSTDDTITVIASVLHIDRFFAGPNPFDTEVTFGFIGTGIAETMTVSVYNLNLAGHLVWTETLTNVIEIKWDGAGLANGAYIYLIEASDGTNNFKGTGKVFINR